MVENLEFQERIYDLANGFLNIAQYPVPESAFVKDEFTEGSPCFVSYGKVLEAYERLCLRLESESGEDPDVEVIINEMNAIMKHMALQMFRYGVLFARREDSMKGR